MYSSPYINLTNSIFLKYLKYSLAMCWNASWQFSSFRTQQKIHWKRRTQSLVTFRWWSILAVESSTSLKCMEPRGSNINAKPKRVRANSTQLNRTSPVTTKEKDYRSVHINSGQLFCQFKFNLSSFLRKY